MKCSRAPLLARLWTSAALAGVLLLAGTQVQAQTSPTCEAIGGTCRPITQDGICESGEQLDHSGTCDSNLKCCAEALCENRGGACQPNVTTCAPGTSSLGNATCSSGRCCTLPTDGPTCGELVGNTEGRCVQSSDSCPDNYTNLGPTKDPCLSCCSPAAGPGPPPTPTPGGSEYKVEFLHTDALGSVRMVTGQTGAVVSRSDYYPFGNKIGAGDTGRDAMDATYLDDPALRQRFTGKERDGESLLDYFGARYYSSAEGRFTVPDSIIHPSQSALNAGDFVQEPGRWNRYAYALNNPIRWADPDGREIPVKTSTGWVGGGLESAPKGSGGIGGNAALAGVGLGFTAALFAPEMIAYASLQLYLNPNLPGQIVEAFGPPGPSFVPSGFSSAAKFEEFGGAATRGVREAAGDGAQAFLAGSAATGKSFKTGAAFDVGRISDFDIALVGKGLLGQAKELGIDLRSRGSRTGPLGAQALEALGLKALAQRLRGLAGRSVNFMIYESEEALRRRGAPYVALDR